MLRQIILNLVLTIVPACLLVLAPTPQVSAYLTRLGLICVKMRSKCNEEECEDGNGPLKG